MILSNMILLNETIVNAGTSNAPEYYINMRTGTHYFPRGVNGVAAVERNCQKFGLNKIEETANESGTQVSNHRRTESFDFTRCNVAIASATNANSSIVMRTMSPDIQRRLAYENYRGFECKANQNEQIFQRHSYAWAHVRSYFMFCS